MTKSIKIPELIQHNLKARQAAIIQAQREIQLMLDTFLATLPEDGNAYQLSDDMSELIEVTAQGIPAEEWQKDGESISE